MVDDLIKIEVMAAEETINSLRDERTVSIHSKQRSTHLFSREGGNVAPLPLTVL